MKDDAQRRIKPQRIHSTTERRQGRSHELATSASPRDGIDTRRPVRGAVLVHLPGHGHWRYARLHRADVLLRRVPSWEHNRFDAAHPRIAAAGTGLDHHSHDPLLLVLRGWRDRVQPCRARTEGRDGDLRHRQAVDVEGSVSERAAGHHRREPEEHERRGAEVDRPARSSDQPPGQASPHFRGRDPRLRSAGVPQQDRRAAGPVHDRLVSADAPGRIPHLLRSVLRNLALSDGRQDRRGRRTGVRRLAAGHHTATGDAKRGRWLAGSRRP